MKNGKISLHRNCKNFQQWSDIGVMQLQLCDSHAASGQMVMLSEFHNLSSQNLAPNFKGGLTWRWRGGGGMGLWNNNFFQSQPVNSSSHWPDCASFPENKSTLEEILSLDKNCCVLWLFRCGVYCCSVHGFGWTNTNLVFLTQVWSLPFFSEVLYSWESTSPLFIVNSSMQSLSKGCNWKFVKGLQFKVYEKFAFQSLSTVCNSKLVKACEGGWCLWGRVPGAV